jgi:hypothetical protein
MNLSPDLNTSTAVFMSLLAAFMWGSWFISLKYLGNYPINGYYVTLFTTSLVFVWTVGFVLDGPALIGNLRQVWAIDPSRIWVTLCCGVLYVFGMRLSIYVMGKIGLSLAQPIQSSINILMGTLVAALVGGVPPNLSVGRLVLACLFLTAAVSITVVAGNLRAQSQKDNHNYTGPVYTNSVLMRSTGLMILSSVFIPAYTFGLSYGLRSITHTAGMAVLPFMAMLCTGAFCGSMLTSGVMLTRCKQWHLVFQAPFSIHKFGIFSGLFHYGGNIIHTFATAFLSSAISWPLGVTSGLWTQLWGMVYGEFKGASRRAYVALFSGIGLYLLGAYLIAFQ